jgi:hypothetical protein
LNALLRTYDRMRDDSPMRAGAFVAALGVIVLLIATSTAWAGSAVDQYSEQIPAAGGERPTQQASASEGSDTAEKSAISATTQAQMEKSKDGADAARVAKETGPVAPGIAGSDGGGGTGGNGGLGLILPLILVGSLLAAVAVLVVRRRQDATP